jgi:DNA polymerase III sliding clamp (beta) subunit (PCNA family)
MLDVLKFVKGAVSKKDFVPALTHFRIADGRVTGYNGKLCLSAPIALDVDCCPKALPFVKAIEACDETAQLHVTPTGKLSIRSGKFRAHVETLDVDVFPDVRPEGLPVDIDGKLLPALRTMYDFISEDASRPWSVGLLMNGDSVFATNNVIVAEMWLGYHFPYRVNVPRYAIKEMIRIGEEPVGLQLSATSMTVHYSEGRWMRAQLIDVDWPNAADLLDSKSTGVAHPFPAGFFEALEKLAPFVDEANRVYLLGDRVSTAQEEGSSVDVAGLPAAAALFNHAMLSLLHGTAHSIDFTAYPAPVPWYGDNVRGLIMGMRG